jgi:predicted DNA-binding protein (MmcQ/YjbR family)
VEIIMLSSLTAQKVEKYLLQKPEAALTYPFGEDVKVLKVKNKMFATLSFGKRGKAMG